MSIIAINANGGAPHHPDGPLDDVLLQHVAAMPKGAPVLIMIHGYRYSLRHAPLSPHVGILSLVPGKGKTRSWPRHMGFHRNVADEGLCIAFGWEASGTLWRAHAEAAQARLALALLIEKLHALGVGPVDVMGHSLGARVVLTALPLLPERSVGRMILLAGAELVSTARHALNSPAGRTAQVLNVTSRENDLFDFGYEWLIAPLSFGARTIGTGLDLPHCVTLQIDAPAHRAAIEALGYPTDRPDRRMCHWSAYTRPGMFPIYRAFLSRPAALPLPLLRTALAAAGTPRWSRLLAWRTDSRATFPQAGQHSGHHSGGPKTV